VWFRKLRRAFRERDRREGIIFDDLATSTICPVSGQFLKCLFPFMALEAVFKSVDADGAWMDV
jgi:hypothetical protein